MVATVYFAVPPVPTVMVALLIFHRFRSYTDTSTDTDSGVFGAGVAATVKTALPPSVTLAASAVTLTTGLSSSATATAADPWAEEIV